jgi:hypothetical protein
MYALYKQVVYVILGFRHEVAEKCSVLRYYAATSGKELPLVAAY